MNRTGRAMPGAARAAGPAGHHRVVPAGPADRLQPFYRDSVGRAAPPVGNARAPPNSTGLATDVDGAPRVTGTIDVGPFELG